MKFFCANKARPSARALLVAIITVLSSTPGATSISWAAGLRVVATGLGFPEGPVIVGTTVYFVDYSTSEVLRVVGDKVDRVWQQAGCGTNGLVAVPAGLFVACYDNGAVVRISFDGETQETITHDDEGHPFLHPNDLAADARGGIYFSASGSESTPGKVFYRRVDGHVREVASNLRYANGLVVSPGGKTLYLAESNVDRLVQFSIGPDGGLADQLPFVALDAILAATGQKAFTPDGVRIDRHGNLFIGLYRGGGFAVVSPDAKLLKYVSVPGAHHANLAISLDGRKVYITSSDDAARQGQLLSVSNPLAE